MRGFVIPDLPRANATGYRRGLYWQIRRDHGRRPGAIVGAEVGVAGGALSYFLLQRFPMLKLFMVDLWGIVPENSTYFRSGDKMARFPAERWAAYERSARNVAKLYFDRAVVCKEASLAAATRLLAEHDGPFLDFFYLDAEHSGVAVAADLRAWWPLLKPGGLAAGDEYKRRWYPEVAPAVEAFFAEVGVPFIAGRSCQFYGRKPK